MCIALAFVLTFIYFITFSIDILNNILFQQYIHSTDNTCD
jgi:hypothetical protein